jgi:hypothetical protein
VRRSTRSAQLDDAERADRVIRVAPVHCERGHQVAERERLPHHRIGRVDRQLVGEHFEHRAVHATPLALAHLVGRHERDRGDALDRRTGVVSSISSPNTPRASSR